MRVPDDVPLPAVAPARAIELAYGLLRCVPVDRRTEAGQSVSMARRALLEQLDRDGEARAMSAARQALDSWRARR